MENVKDYLKEIDIDTHNNKNKLKIFITLYKNLNYSPILNKKLVKKCSFILNSMTDKELNSLFSNLNFNIDQLKLSNEINDLYTDEMIENSKIIKIDDKRFIISKKNYKNLTKEHIETLKILIKNETLYNPVFIELDNEKRLIID